MSYRPNQSQQLSIFDRSLRLTERERKCLEKSWAKVFSDEIFPAIDEDRFRVLYSETASRPNTPVNVIVGALIIKIYGSKEEIRARKSPETVDAPGFAPDASIPVILYGGDTRI